MITTKKTRKEAIQDKSVCINPNNSTSFTYTTPLFYYIKFKLYKLFIIYFV